MGEPGGSANGMLSGIRVVEVAQYAAGPAAGAVLSDYGADVVHVEEPGHGDPYRRFHSQAWGAIQGFNSTFELLNRNKRSLALSLKEPEGQEALHRLVARADVFITNYLPNRLDAMAMDADTLMRVNPRLVYAAISGYGGQGPDRSKPSFDFSAFWTASGLMATISPGDEPVVQRPGMGDRSVGAMTAGAIGLALFARERTGQGQRVELSLMHLGMWMLGSDLQRLIIEGTIGPKTPRAQAPNPLWNTYRTGDGRWVMLTMRPEYDWQRFCRALEVDHLATDERFATVKAREKHCPELIAELDRVMVRYGRDEWQQRFEAGGIIWAPVNELKDLIAHPQAEANGWFFEAVHPDAGQSYPMLRPPMSFPGQTPRYQHPAPRIGEHTDEVLREVGYSDADIASLRERRIVR